VELFLAEKELGGLDGRMRELERFSREREWVFVVPLQGRILK
jgi:hypothetical protein